MFGGIHDITWELDDLHIYEIKVKYILFSETNGPLSNKTLPEKSKRNNSNTKKVSVQVSVQEIRKLTEKTAKRKAGTILRVTHSKKIRTHPPETSL